VTSARPGGRCKCAPRSTLEVQDRMKKISLLFLLLPMLATASFAQESRQDASVSGTLVFPPYVTGQGVYQSGCLAPSIATSAVNSTSSGGGTCFGPGVLASYRYMVTPRSALEVNYQWTQFYTNYIANVNNVNIHTRMQEISAAYVFNFTFRNWNPFLEAGPGGFIFSALDDRGTQQFNPKRTTNIGALYGGGIAYELSPSFDIRAEYRGIIIKAPDFGFTNFDTKRYYNISAPAIGIAYHF
jgi:outer membrane immunogenic protein